MTDIALDPIARDYSGGRLETLGNAVYLRIMTPLGSYWADPTVGSKLHLLQREKDLQRVAILAKQYSEQALQPLIDDGRAQSVEVTVERPGNGRLHLLVEVVDAGGERQMFGHYIKVSDAS
jgi:phage gp46-like protein